MMPNSLTQRVKREYVNVTSVNISISLSVLPLHNKYVSTIEEGFAANNSRSLRNTGVMHATRV